MTRKPATYGGVTAQRTFFKWRLCCCCGLEFRRENGWVAYSYLDSWDALLTSLSIPHYMCETCAPDRSTASKIAFLKPWVPPMPKCKPPRAR